MLALRGYSRSIGIAHPPIRLCANRRLFTWRTLASFSYAKCNLTNLTLLRFRSTLARRPIRPQKREEQKTEEEPPKDHYSNLSRAKRFGIELAAIAMAMGITGIVIILSKPYVAQFGTFLTWQTAVLGVGAFSYYIITSFSRILQLSYKFPMGKFGHFRPLLVVGLGLVADFFLQFTLGAFFPQDEEPELRQMAISGKYLTQMVVLGPMIEELLFRWLLFGRLFQSVGLVPAYIFNIPLFGMAHYSESSTKVVASGLAGLLFTVTYHASGKLWVPMLTHSILNGIACSYHYLLHPSLEKREERLYAHSMFLIWHANTLAPLRALLSREGLVPNELVGKDGGPSEEMKQLSDKLFTQLTQPQQAQQQQQQSQQPQQQQQQQQHTPQTITCEQFAPLVGHFPDVRVEVNDALAVLVGNARQDHKGAEEIVRDCKLYVDDTAKGFWGAAFHSQTSVEREEFERAMFELCLENKNFKALKQFSQQPRPVEFAVPAPSRFFSAP